MTGAVRGANDLGVRYADQVVDGIDFTERRDGAERTHECRRVVEFAFEHDDPPADEIAARLHASVREAERSRDGVRVDGDVVLHAQRIAEVPDDALGLGNAAHPVARRVAANELHEAVGEDHPPRPVDGDEEIALGVGPILRFVDEDVVLVEARTIFFHDRGTIGSYRIRAEAVGDFAKRRVGAVVIIEPSDVSGTVPPARGRAVVVELRAAYRDRGR